MWEEFSVYWFDPDGISHREAAFIGVRQAVELARSLTKRPAAKIKIRGRVVIQRVIITDGGDHTVFEWKYGKGVTFPITGIT